MRRIRVLLPLLLLISVQNAFAVETDYNKAMTTANVFIQSVNSFMQNITIEPDLSSFVTSVWLFFAGIAILPALIGWARDASKLELLLVQANMVLITGWILMQYNFLTGLVWGVNEGIAGGIQNAAVGNPDPFFLPAFIHDVIAAIDRTGISWLEGMRVAFSGWIIMPALALLSIASLLVNIWCLWVFCIAKIIGFFIVPFLLSKRFHFIFDGWLRFLLAYVIYGIIARINLVLCAILIRAFFNLPSFAAPVEAIPLSMEALPQMIGLISFNLIAILALIQTGRFAQSIISGATGFGESIRSLAVFAAGKIV